MEIKWKEWKGTENIGIVEIILKLHIALLPLPGKGLEFWLWSLTVYAAPTVKWCHWDTDLDLYLLRYWWLMFCCLHSHTNVLVPMTSVCESHDGLTVASPAKLSGSFWTLRSLALLASFSKSYFSQSFFSSWDMYELSGYPVVSSDHN